ncbi:MAG TPA: hypothetical protein VGQ45_13000 [Gaiellales bacterium]|nr:hypothetical protein [Gaiellales bacterium]
MKDERSLHFSDVPTSWQRLAALSGFAFTVFLVLAWFLNGAETPKYLAPDHDWTTWAHNTEMKGRFAAFFALLAGLTFLPFAATIRALLEKAEGEGNGRARLTQVAYAGGLIGITSFVIATVSFSGASAEGAQASPEVSRAIATGAVGPFLVAPMGFAAFLGAGGLLALRTGALPRWTAFVAMIGAVSFTITFLTTLDGTADGSVFGYGFFPGIVALIIWSVATSIAAYRGLLRSADTSVVVGAKA